MIPGSANLFYRTLLMLGGSQEVADGGSGYTVGDVLTVAGGASATAGTVTVDSVLQTAGGFTPGSSYTIVSAGDTDFTAIGAANNNPGTTFTASGAGSGTGTASTATAAEVGKVHTVTVTEPGKYAVVPTSPASTTGGTGSGATITPGWTQWVFTAPVGFTLTAVYTEDPETGEYTYGFVGVGSGSITPDAYLGDSINSLYSYVDPGVQSYTTLVIGNGVPQDHFASITANGVTLHPMNAVYASQFNSTQWVWDGEVMFTAATDYPVSIA